ISRGSDLGILISGIRHDGDVEGVLGVVRRVVDVQTTFDVVRQWLRKGFDIAYCDAEPSPRPQSCKIRWLVKTHMPRPRPSHRKTAEYRHSRIVDLSFRMRIIANEFLPSAEIDGSRFHILLPRPSVRVIPPSVWFQLHIGSRILHRLGRLLAVDEFDFVQG